MKSRHLLSASTALNCILLVILCCAAGKPPAVEQAGIEVRFSPNGGCARAVVEQIEAAQRSLDIAAYHVTNASIAKAIVQANRRGVSVRIVMDDEQSRQKYSSATFLHNEGLPVQIWTGGTMHNKFVIVDGKSVVTGSFNFTKSADEENAENLLILENKSKIAAAYRQHFERLVERSRRYSPQSGEK